jgi:hypothetical protein
MKYIASHTSIAKLLGGSAGVPPAAARMMDDVSI